MNEGKSSITNNQENSTNDSVENYFATARLTRDQAKDQAGEVLMRTDKLRIHFFILLP
jgi:hypothetical protein